MQMTSQLKKILSEVQYPADKKEIMDTAKKENATPDEINMIQKLSDRQFSDMTEVTDEMDKMAAMM